MPSNNFLLEVNQKIFFRLYDLNGDGSITKSEMASVVVAVYELLGVECATLVIIHIWVNVHHLRLRNNLKHFHCFSCLISQTSDCVFRRMCLVQILNISWVVTDVVSTLKFNSSVFCEARQHLSWIFCFTLCSHDILVFRKAFIPVSIFHIFLSKKVSILISQVLNSIFFLRLMQYNSNEWWSILT